MPARNRHRRAARKSRRQAISAAAVAAASSPPASVVDSDQASTSLPSSVCDDYFARMLEAGLEKELGALHNVEPLDLTAGLDLSPIPDLGALAIPGEDTSSGAPRAAAGRHTAPAHGNALVRMEQDTSSPEAKHSNQSPAMLSADVYAPAKQARDAVPTSTPSAGLSVAAKEFVPAGAASAKVLSPAAKAFVPGTQAFASANDSVEGQQMSAILEPASTAQDAELLVENPIYHPQYNMLDSFDRASWELVESEVMRAFRVFQAHATKGTTFACVGMPQPKTRLALHRCAEVMGTLSSSYGTGKYRHVVLKWNKDEPFSISETAMRNAVRNVLAEVFQPETASPLTKAQLKKALKREKKIAAQVEFLDSSVDPDLVEELVVKKDWYALQKLYEGVPVPGLAGKKRKDKKERKRVRREAMLQANPVDKAPALNTGSKSRGPSGAAMIAPPLKSSNKGYAMLEKMGWRDGQGLGSSKDGITQPLKPEVLKKRVGLGS